jgi:hypothetical protein
VIHRSRRWQWCHGTIVHGALNAEIAESHEKMDAVGAILTTRGNVASFDATKQDTEREI